MFLTIFLRLKSTDQFVQLIVHVRVGPAMAELENVTVWFTRPATFKLKNVKR